MGLVVDVARSESEAVEGFSFGAAAVFVVTWTLALGGWSMLRGVGRRLLTGVSFGGAVVLVVRWTVGWGGWSML